MNKDFTKELATYLNKDIVLVGERCKYTVPELAWQWHDNHSDLIKFYKETDLYLFDLTMYCNHLQERKHFDWYEDKLKQLKLTTLLDFGGGIGEYSIVAWLNSYQTTYCDILDSQTAEYAKHRFSTYNVNPTIMGEQEAIPAFYDIIVAMDVIEHLPDADKWVRSIAEHCKYAFINPEVPYSIFYPQHISKVNLAPFFDQVEGNLWKSKLN
jgi:SAM-dependent methyltransferase